MLIDLFRPFLWQLLLPPGEVAPSAAASSPPTDPPSPPRRPDGCRACGGGPDGQGGAGFVSGRRCAACGGSGWTHLRVHQGHVRMDADPAVATSRSHSTPARGSSPQPEDTAAVVRPPLFSLGRLYLTRGARAALTAAGQTPVEFLGRHLRGDWGDLSPEDARANDDALVGGCILSAYHTRTGTRIWIITEGDRSATTVLLPSEH